MMKKVAERSPTTAASYYVVTLSNFDIASYYVVTIVIDIVHTCNSFLAIIFATLIEHYVHRLSLSIPLTDIGIIQSFNRALASFQPVSLPCDVSTELHREQLNPTILCTHALISHAQHRLNFPRYSGLVLKFRVVLRVLGGQ